MYRLISQLEARDEDTERWARELDDALTAGFAAVVVDAEGTYWLAKEVKKDAD